MYELIAVHFCVGIGLSDLDSSARYAPANVQQALGDMQQTLANIQGTLADLQRDDIRGNLANLQRAVDVIIDGQRINQAVTANNRIVSRNSRLQQPNPYSPLQKTVSLSQDTSSLVLNIVYRFPAPGTYWQIRFGPPTLRSSLPRILHRGLVVFQLPSTDRLQPTPMQIF